MGTEYEFAGGEDVRHAISRAVLHPETFGRAIRMYPAGVRRRYGLSVTEYQRMIELINGYWHQFQLDQIKTQPNAL